jgi:hypothetical protein
MEKEMNLLNQKEISMVNGGGQCCCIDYTYNIATIREVHINHQLFDESHFLFNGHSVLVYKDGVNNDNECRLICCVGANILGETAGISSYVHRNNSCSGKAITYKDTISCK